MNKQYTFTCHSTPNVFTGQSDGIEYTINDEKTRDEILESFRNFLIASGYQFKLTETIQVVDEDWHEPGEGLDDVDGVTLAYNPHQASIFWTDEETSMKIKGWTDAE